ncbi:MAG: hypothetical protein RIQ54_549 [Candidatus Parcubacteria bacterium]|jgi:phosphomannomutase
MRSVESKLFRSYDVRGLYPSQLNESIVRDIAHAFFLFLKSPRCIVVGRDVRDSGKPLSSALIETFRALGVSVIDIGIVPAEVFYFSLVHFSASGGVFVSASHNPAGWNGLNFAGYGAVGISHVSGLAAIERIFLRLRNAAAKNIPSVSPQKGSLQVVDISKPYLSFFKSLVRSFPRPIRPLRIVIDGNFGASAQWFSRIARVSGYPIHLYPIRNDFRGDVPQKKPNPLFSSNRQQLQRAVVSHQADFGVAWDLDGDRCFFVDHAGRFIQPPYISMLLTEAVLRRYPHSLILCDNRFCLGVRSVARRMSGRFAFTKPGMTVVSGMLSRRRGVFACEASAHYYFSDTFYRDSGFLPIFYITSLFIDQNVSLQSLVAPLQKSYPVSAEINFPLSSPLVAKKILTSIAAKYRTGTISFFEGLSVSFKHWRFVVRISSTEPLLRLTVEATSRPVLRKELALLRGRIRLLVSG